MNWQAGSLKVLHLWLKFEKIAGDTAQLTVEAGIVVVAAVKLSIPT
jgi:hypothetical protein